MLQGVLSRAVEWGYLDRNAASVLKKPSQRRTRDVRRVAPIDVERLRGRFLAQEDRQTATLICLIAYAGLRPGEALGLRWADIRDNTILVERSAVGGDVKTTKTGRVRTVPLLRPLASDLREFRLSSGRPSDDAFLFARSDGRVWTEDDWRNWRKRRFLPAAESLGIEGLRPYDLRHSFCSLQLYAGLTIVEVAAQAGHSPAVSLGTYQHVMAELEGSVRRPAEGLDRRRASAGCVRKVSGRLGGGGADCLRTASPREADERIRTADPFITSEQVALRKPP